MEKKEILAEFMGFVNGGDFWASSGKKPFITEINGHRFYPADLMFDTDRNWFHPVWEKFRDLKFEDDGSPPIYDHGIWVSKIAEKITYSTLPEAFEELVRGVIWYNSIKEK